MNKVELLKVLREAKAPFTCNIDGCTAPVVVRVAEDEGRWGSERTFALDEVGSGQVFLVSLDEIKAIRVNAAVGAEKDIRKMVEDLGIKIKGRN